MIYCVDIDGTICDTPGNDYPKAIPRPGVINKINMLYDEGNTIWFFTSRGTTSGKDWYNFTFKQLVDWGVRYNKLIMNKPPADVFIDDKNGEL
jgi:trehalose-6-phosphatase